MLPRLEVAPASGQRVAVVGAGPAGLAAASLLARAGHEVHLLERARRAGGMARLIPRHRLDPEVLAGDVAWLLAQGNVHLCLGRPVALPRELLARGFAAVMVTAGLSEPVELDVPGRARALRSTDVLGPRPPSLRGRRVAVVGDGAVAVDCAAAALARGAAHVELLALRKLSELELSRRERDPLLASGVHLSGRVRVTALHGRGTRVTRIDLRRVELPAGVAFHPSRLVDLPRSDHERRDLDAVILALGSRAGLRLEAHPRVFYAGDLEHGPSSVVEAVASGKAAARAVHALLAGDDAAACPDRGSCADGNGCPRRSTCPERSRPATPGRAAGATRPAAGLPVPLAADFFGRELASPFLLAAAPFTAGYDHLRRAYERGWAGATLRLSLDGDGWSPALDRACAAVERLGREFPDRLTVVAPGGSAAGGGDDSVDRWEAATRRLGAAGAGAIEVPARTASLVDAVLAAAEPRVPVLFRLSGGVLSTEPRLADLAATLGRHPPRPAGVALASDDEAALRDAAERGLLVSCEGAVLDHRAAARHLALGARLVACSALVVRYGLGIVGELHAGLSHFLAERGLRAVSELAGAPLALPRPPAGEPQPGTVCEVDAARCTGCGNCTRCPSGAVTLGARGLATVDRSRCAGCGLCVLQCFAGAVALRRAA